MLLTDFYRDQFAPLRLRSRTDNTRRLYECTLRSFARFAGREPLMSDLNDATIARYLCWYRSLPRSPASVNKERNNLLAMWRWANRRKFIDTWPDVEAETEPRRVPLAWTREQLRALYEALAAEPGVIGGVPACRWWLALHAVIWDTGERISAVLNLRWDTVDLSGGWLVVPASLRKGNRADKLSRLHADTVHSLRAIRLPSRAEVFPWPYCPNYLWHRYGRLLKTAGLPHDSRSKFHRLRRTVASFFEAAGGNATELLGHAHRRTTLAYLDPRIVPQQYAADLLFRPGRR